MTPKPIEWWLRPVMIAAREGEHSAVELKLVYRRPFAAIRSRFGVGITPPNVLDTPKPVSSVMMSKTFGAPLGGTTRIGQYGVDCAALRSILPSNFGGGGGNWFPSIVVVALGEPGVPVICCGSAGSVVNSAARVTIEALVIKGLGRMITSEIIALMPAPSHLDFEA